MPRHELKSMNVERVVVFRQLPIIRPTRKKFEEIRRWHLVADIPIEDIKVDALVLIGSDVPEAQWILEQRLGGR